MKTPYAHIRDYIKNDKKIKLYHNDYDLLDEWSNGILPIEWEGYDLENITLSVSDVSDIYYDHDKSAWIKRSDNRTDRLFYVFVENDNKWHLRELGCRWIPKNGNDDITIEKYDMPIMNLTGLRQLLDYIELLRLKPNQNDDEGKTTSVLLSAIFKNIYFPFFKEMDDLKSIDPDPITIGFNIKVWVKFEKIFNLFQESRKNGEAWLEAITERANGLDMGKQNFEIRLNQVVEVRSKLSDDAFLNIDDINRYIVLSTPTCQISYPMIDDTVPFGSVSGYPPLLCEISSKYSCGYIASFLNSVDGVESLKALKEYMGDGVQEHFKNVHISIPDYKEQLNTYIKESMDMFYLESYCQMLPSKIKKQKGKLTPKQNIEFIKSCRGILDISNSIDKKLHNDLARVIDPLPYFIEYPLLVWQQSNEKMAYRNGMALFLQLHRISCLLAFESFRQSSENIIFSSLLGEGLIKELMGRPTMGSWVKALDTIGRNSEKLSMWQPWFKVFDMNSDKRQLILRNRNKIEHPNYIPDENFIDQSAEALGDFFEKIMPALRKAYSNIRTYISHDRRLVVSDKNIKRVVMNCESFDTSNEPFPRKSLSIDPIIGNTIADDQLFCISGDEVIILENFFKIKTISSKSREIFVYEKEYSGEKALWSGLTTDQAHTMSAHKGLFGLE